MNWAALSRGFELGFPIVMILSPGLFVWFVARSRARAGAELHAGARPPAARLAAGTLAAIAIYVVWRFVFGIGYGQFLWVFFFPLWFGLAMPTLRELDEGWRGPPQTTKRAATLVRRDLPPAHVRAWNLVAGCWLAITLATTLVLILVPGQADRWRFSSLAVLALLMMSGLWALGGRFIARLSASEPERLDVEGHLTNDYRRLRDLKLRGWLALAVVMVVCFALPALLLSIGARLLVGSAIVLMVLGTALGAGLGAFIGIRADLSRTRIHRHHRELARERVDSEH